MHYTVAQCYNTFLPEKNITLLDDVFWNLLAKGKFTVISALINSCEKALFSQEKTEKIAGILKGYLNIYKIEGDGSHYSTFIEENIKSGINYATIYSQHSQRKTLKKLPKRFHRWYCNQVNGQYQAQWVFNQLKTIEEFQNTCENLALFDTRLNWVKYF